MLHGSDCDGLLSTLIISWQWLAASQFQASLTAIIWILSPPLMLNPDSTNKISQWLKKSQKTIELGRLWCAIGWSKPLELQDHHFNGGFEESNSSTSGNRYTVDINQLCLVLRNAVFKKFQNYQKNKFTKVTKTHHTTSFLRSLVKTSATISITQIHEIREAYILAYAEITISKTNFNNIHS